MAKLTKRSLMLGAGLALAWVLLAAGVALSDTILHEFFILPPDERGNTTAGGGGGEAGEGEGDALSEALNEAKAEGEIPPPLTIENLGDEMEMGPQGQPLTPDGQGAADHNGPFDAEDLAKPDRQTTLDSELTYFTVFNPSVVPWKRVQARDEVHKNYELGVKNKTVHRIEPRDTAVRDRYERFWGSMLIQMRPGQRIPLPSVSPEATILRVQTEPPTEMKFFKDNADNFFVEGNRKGAVRLNYQMEAHSNYFGGEIDGGLRVTDLPRSQRPKLPPDLQKSAQTAIEAIGIDRQAPMRDQLNKLVGYFRAFEAKDFPTEQKSEDIYLDLTLNQIGVCRHRAFAFVVTAHGLGIMARYVHNEAHAFVEVRVPRRGWLRIDLGGAAVDFNVRNSSDKVLHAPPDEDTFPQPENFTQSYSRQLGLGESEADIDGDGNPDSMDGVPDRANPRLGPGDNAQPNPEPQEGEWVEEDEGDDTSVFPKLEDENYDEGPSSPIRRPSQLVIDSAKTPQGVFQGDALKVLGSYRGDKLEIVGFLTDRGQGSGLGAQGVEAFLLPKGKNSPKDLILVGEGQTDSKGQVRIEASIPDTLALGRWGLYLYFRGSNTHSSSDSH